MIRKKKLKKISSALIQRFFSFCGENKKGTRCACGFLVPGWEIVLASRSLHYYFCFFFYDEIIKSRERVRVRIIYSCYTAVASAPINYTKINPFLLHIYRISTICVCIVCRFLPCGRCVSRDPSSVVTLFFPSPVFFFREWDCSSAAYDDRSREKKSEWLSLSGVCLLALWSEAQFREQVKHDRLAR